MHKEYTIPAKDRYWMLDNWIPLKGSQNKRRTRGIELYYATPHHLIQLQQLEEQTDEEFTECIVNNWKTLYKQIAEKNPEWIYKNKNYKKPYFIENDED